VWSFFQETYTNACGTPFHEMVVTSAFNDAQRLIAVVCLMHFLAFVSAKAAELTLPSDPKQNSRVENTFSQLISQSVNRSVYSRLRRVENKNHKCNTFPICCFSYFVDFCVRVTWDLLNQHTRCYQPFTVMIYSLLIA